MGEASGDSSSPTPNSSSYKPAEELCSAKLFLSPSFLLRTHAHTHTHSLPFLLLLICSFILPLLHFLSFTNSRNMSVSFFLSCSLLKSLAHVPFLSFHPLSCSFGKEIWGRLSGLSEKTFCVLEHLWLTNTLFCLHRFYSPWQVKA